LVEEYAAIHGSQKGVGGEARTEPGGGGPTRRSRPTSPPPPPGPTPRPCCLLVRDVQTLTPTERAAPAPLGACSLAPLGACSPLPESTRSCFELAAPCGSSRRRKRRITDASPSRRTELAVVGLCMMLSLGHAGSTSTSFESSASLPSGQAKRLSSVNDRSILPPLERCVPAWMLCATSFCVCTSPTSAHMADRGGVGSRSRTSRGRRARFQAGPGHATWRRAKRRCATHTTHTMTLSVQPG
jgi:hypothetical protein